MGNKLNASGPGLWFACPMVAALPSAARPDMKEISRTAQEFMFCTGIENSYPLIRWQGKTVRRDGMEMSAHYRRWREDFDLVKGLGLHFLRYGPPLYKTWRAGGHYDWELADQTFERLRRLKIHPITDLCHFGLPDWLGDFQNPDFPQLFAHYARAFARRFNWVRLYTPVNEIFIAAEFSAKRGWWNECLTTDKAFVTALKHLVRANVLAEEAILEVQPRASFIQSESTSYFHQAGPKARDAADMSNQRRFLSLDLNYGNDVTATLYEYLLDNGMTRDEYHWFMAHGRALTPHCIMGNDYYPSNEHLVGEDGRVEPSGEIFGYYVITHQYYQRYQLPVMHTETNLKAGENAACDWLHKEWQNVLRLKADGVPIMGFTWYSLIDQTDWDVGLREIRNKTNPCGLYDKNRKPHPVAQAYRKLIAEWRPRVPREEQARNLHLAWDASDGQDRPTARPVRKPRAADGGNGEAGLRSTNPARARASRKAARATSGRE